MKTLQSKGTRVLKGCASRQFFEGFSIKSWVLILVDMIGNRYI